MTDIYIYSAFELTVIKLSHHVAKDEINVPIALSAFRDNTTWPRAATLNICVCQCWCEGGDCVNTCHLLT